MITEEEDRHARAHAKGLCQACKAGAGLIVRRRPDGTWARFTADGRWRTFDEQPVPVHELQGAKDEVVVLDVIRAREREPRTLISGRIVALCQACREADDKPARGPEPPANLELGL